MEVSNLDGFKLNVKVNFVEMLNYSLVNNDFLLINEITVTSEQEFKEPKSFYIKIYAESGFIFEYQQEFLFVENYSEYIIKKPTIPYNYDYFREINERIKTYFFVEILDGNNNIVFKSPYKINILPYQHWLGSNIYPELTCSYIVPNDDEVRRIVSEAGVKLKEWTGNPTFDGYQSGESEKVRLQAAAIYASLQKDNIAYKNPPASFEKFGQKIRYPQEIIKYKNGTCLDLAFLYAACLEAVGLNALVVFIKEHAFAGYWLIDKNFKEPYIDDYATISKRLSNDIKEIDVVETTAFVNGHSYSFEDAIESAYNSLNNPYNYTGTVDVSSGRQYGITPVITKSDQSNFVMEGYGERTIVTDAPNTVIERKGDIEFKVDAIEKTDIWSRNLLDLTLRNPLINFKVNKSAIQLMVYDLANLEDELASSKSFKVIEKPDNFIIRDANVGIFNPKELEFKFSKLIDADFKDKRIRSFLTDYMLEKQLKDIYRKARVNLDENGANSLFLAVGMLKWCENNDRSQFYRAPIVLLPLSIEKKNAGSQFLIGLSDDDPELNITLIEYLRQKFNIDLRYLIDMPRDESGIDISLLFSTIRKAILDKIGWDIEEIAVISNFSFSKFVMWNDLQNRKNEIASNKNVQALINGNYEDKKFSDLLSAKEIENNFKPHEISSGSTVDAYQLEAINASTSSSFVLHGPPGTGKSQTITNMILHNLNLGKKVLFVAEKQAALNVVSDRLSKLGLNDFALELHSNKTKKSLFLNKVEKSLNKDLKNEKIEIESKSNNIYELKKELNTFVDVLHKKQSSGYSLYELIQLHEQFKSVSNIIEISDNKIKNLSKIEINKIKDLAKMTDQTIKQLNYKFNTHPLQDFKLTKYSISKGNSFDKNINQFKNASFKIVDLLKCHVNQYDIDNVEELISLGESINLIKDYNLDVEISDNMFISYKNIPLNQAFDYASQTLEQYRKSMGYLIQKYNKQILSINVPYLKSEYFEAKSKLFKGKKIKKIISNLEALLIEYHTMEEHEFERDLQNIADFQNSRNELQRNNENIQKTFGKNWKGKNTDLELLKKQVNFIEQNKIQEISKNEQSLIKLLIKLNVEEPSIFIEIYESVLTVNQKIKTLVEDYNLNLESIQRIQIEKMENTINSWSKSKSDLKTLSLVNNQMFELESSLNTSVRYVFVSEDHNNTIYELVFKEIVEKLIRLYFNSYEILDSFNGYEIDQKIKLLKEKEKEFNTLIIEKTKNQLSDRLEAMQKKEDYEKDFLVLQKAIRSKGRGQSIRTIFNKTSNIIQDLFPVMLMSPLSIAQYIDPKFPKYDLVIFDEASQIPTDVAIGAVSRAENCIVVGDPKQMPPTTFFGSNNIDEDNIELEDLESLLDDCLAANFPEKYLQWHYRSQHESLIHFSNRTYYNNQLQTYPSIDSLTSKVKFENINGTYKRGSYRYNEKEAKYIVNKIIEHLKSETKESIGVITFNIQQQNLIEDLLNEQLSKNKDLDVRNMKSKEPVFVKNLENVQGDERDIILFSITFGPDETDKMTMNFGPLNNSGGWRRLNVAITRARKEMYVIGSFEPEKIDLNRTKADGVLGLKGFLSYANNPETLPSIINKHVVEKNSIALLLKKRLESKGFESVVHLGSSNFKIDLAVFDPADKRKYKLAILIDGETYYSGQTANDRNIIQPNILKSLGWSVYRLWSIDWYENSNKELNKILEILK